jgi:hypothetical protein
VAGWSSRKERGHARLPDPETARVVNKPNLEGSQVSKRQLRQLGVGKAGMPPLLATRLRGRLKLANFQTLSFLLSQLNLHPEQRSRKGFSLCISHERQGATSAQAFMQQKIERAEIR